MPAKQCSVGLRLLENLHPLAGVWEEWGQNKQRPGSAVLLGVGRPWGWWCVSRDADPSGKHKLCFS